MAEKSFQDVIDRIVAEGQLTRNSGAHSIRTVKEVLRDQTEETRAQTDELKNAIGKAAGAQIANARQSDNLTKGDDVEAAREQDNFENKMLTVLEGILENTAGNLKPQKEEKEDKGPTLIDIGLGAILAGGTLGAAAGIVLGQLKAIETLIPGIKGMRIRLVTFFTETIPDILKGMKNSIVSKFRGMVVGISMQIDLMKIAFTDFVGRFSKVLKPLGTIMKPFTAVIGFFKGYIGGIITRFVDAGKAIGEAGKGLKDFFGGKFKIPGLSFITDGIKMVKDFFAGFGKVFGAVARVVGKIFAPIAIVMSVIDTVTGFMDGFKEEGIIGGIKGAIKGLINGLINAPLDMLKNGIAWIMGKFGVNPETVDAVKSFSFAESFNKIVDGLFELPKKAIAWMSEKFTSISETVGEFITNVMGDPLGFVSKIIAAPYELLQKGVAWILSKLGFENAAEDVESFDIAGKIKEVISGVTKLFTDAIDFYVGIFMKAKEYITGLISGDFSLVDVFKDILRNILPDPSIEREWYDPIGLVQRAIPDSVYDFAGIDPETGEQLEQLPVPTVPEVEVPDTTIEPALDTTALEQGVAAAQNATRIEIPVETRTPVVGAAVETDDVRVERNDVTGREAQQLALSQQQQELDTQRAVASTTAMVLNSPTSVQNNSTVSNSSTTVGMMGTSGDPLDKSWGGIG